MRRSRILEEYDKELAKAQEKDCQPTLWSNIKWQTIYSWLEKKLPGFLAGLPTKSSGEAEDQNHRGSYHILIQPEYVLFGEESTPDPWRNN